MTTPSLEKMLTRMSTIIRWAGIPSSEMETTTCNNYLFSIKMFKDFLTWKSFFPISHSRYFVSLCSSTSIMLSLISPFNPGMGEVELPPNPHLEIKSFYPIK